MVEKKLVDINEDDEKTDKVEVSAIKKKPRTQKQIDAFNKMRENRMKKLAEKKEKKDEPKNEIVEEVVEEDEPQEQVIKRIIKKKKRPVKKVVEVVVEDTDDE